MDIRKFFFSNRSYTPIPLALLIIYNADPIWHLLPIGAFLLAAGEWLRLNAVRYAGGATRTMKVGAPSLCTSGPYAYVRNPLYVGNMIIYTGIAFLAGGQALWFMLVLTWLFFGVQYGLIVHLEEETLDKLFGSDYATYKEFIPALIPRFTPWSGRDDREPASWRKTFKTEKRTLQNILFILIILWLRVTI